MGIALGSGTGGQARAGHREGLLPQARWPLLVAGALAAALSTWGLWEQDIFWQVRAGSELLDLRRLPSVDTWSYTAAGTDWHNVEWLSTVIFAVAFRLFGVTGLLALRALLTAALIYVIGAAQQAAAPRLAQPLRWSLLALTYLGLSPRLQVRPELFALLCFAGLLWVWLSGLEPRRKRLVTLGLMLLTSNLHAGLTPFFGLVAAAFFIGDGDARPLLAGYWLPALLLAAFCNPQPLAGLEHVLRHLFYFSDKVIPNPEQQRLTFSALLEGSERWALWGVVLLLALSQAWLWRREPAVVVGYGPRRWPRAVALLLAALCFERVRAAPFLVLYVAPLAALLLQHWQTRWSGAQRQAVAVAGCAAVGLLALLAPPYPFGTGLTPGIWPVDSVAFIKKTRPQPNLFHPFNFGAYLVGYLPEYKVFGDTREVPFRDLESAYQAAFESRSGLDALVERFDINTLLLATPPTKRLDDDSGYFDVLEAYAPAEKWALVHFDAASVVLLRRTQANAAIIAEHEYRWLRPGVPPAEIQRVAALNPSYTSALQQEVARCLSEVPELKYCAELTARAR